MKRYVQIDLSLKDKFKLFFFNIIPEDKVTSSDTHSQFQQVQSTERNFSTEEDSDQEDINSTEVNIPFFDFDQTNKKSNF